MYHFNLVEFAEWSGYGFRTIQARAMGVALPDARIIVRLHSSSAWCREANRSWVAGADDLIRDYYERYSFEHADFQLSPSQYMLDYARSIGWKVRADARVAPNPFPSEESAPADSGSDNLELVFFGRLETRKGLKTFVEAAQSIPRDISICFLGRETPIDGVGAKEFIAGALKGRPHKVLSQLNREGALAYLRGPNRIAIMPSLVENYPYTVLECAVNRIPLLASKVGGIPEVVASDDLRTALLFEPNPKSLRNTLDRYLATEPLQRQAYVEQLHETCDVPRNLATVQRTYAQLRVSALVKNAVTAPEPALESTPKPLVSVVVPYYNMGEFLPATLHSLAIQDYPNTEVIVVNDGSTEAESLKTWDHMQKRYPRFRFITQENQGLSGARNGGLAVAHGEYFIPVDADNVARPNMVSQFVSVLQRNPQMAAVSSYFLAFENDRDIAAGRFLYAYRPCGGPFVAAALRNVYGDANSMFRTAAVREVGGYETDRDSTWEDWELFVKLVGRGATVDVVPEYLFYYRHRPGSLFRTTDYFLNRRRVLRQFFKANLQPAQQMELWTAFAGLEEVQRGAGSLHGIVSKSVRRSTVERITREIRRNLRKGSHFLSRKGAA